MPTFLEWVRLDGRAGGERGSSSGRYGLKPFTGASPFLTALLYIHGARIRPIGPLGLVVGSSKNATPSHYSLLHPYLAAASAIVGRLSHCYFDPFG